jgi:hydroxyethylthiazole kinase-like uncharacterized protein yjeF
LQKIFLDTKTLDERCFNEFFLNEDILMEHAGNGIANFIRRKFKKESTILIVSGGGNNGADGIVVSRLLNIDFDVKLYIFKQPKTQIGKIQLKRALAVGVDVLNEYPRDLKADVIVDSLVGTGLKQELRSEYTDLIYKLNLKDAFKIACDIPSGITQNGSLSSRVFKADTTITMGTLKLSLFSDIAKDFTGDISVINLGVTRDIYEDSSSYFLLEKKDLKLPFRNKKNTHKGDFGHVAILSGDKDGASILAGLSAFNFGAGLVSIISNQKKINIPYELMTSNEIPKNSSVIVAGMGLGLLGIEYYYNLLIKTDLPLVIDADIFHSKLILELLKNNNKMVLTPHPKEFISMFNLIFSKKLTVEELLKNRILYLTQFTEKYPNIVLLLKGANSVIVHNNKFYFNNLGNAILSKGGSGDILSGLIGSLIAQGESLKQATINSLLAHSIAPNQCEKNNYALSPMDLINLIAKIK